MSLSCHSPDIPHTPAQLRARIRTCKQADPTAWEQTRKLVHPAHMADTAGRLAERIQGSALPTMLRERLAASLRTPRAPARVTAGDNTLKECTGLPRTKAIRALCLYFALVQDNAPASSSLAPRDVEAFARHNASPYELLLRADTPSLLDLGAGDLSFEEDLCTRYLPPLRQHGKVLTLHALDRLRPGSQWGGGYHASPERLRRFAHVAPDCLQFRFWGGVDMLDQSKPRALLSRYTIVTCHAPATPTFAYEPSRLSPSMIKAHLARTKGDSRTIRAHGEDALQVMHRGKRLTFPPWKFSIQGPVRLLHLMAGRGELCVLSAIDDEVFWEILAQLVDDPAMRPADVVFTPDVLPEVFGHVHRALTALRVGERRRLSDVAMLRQALPAATRPRDGTPARRFRFVEIRRGAVFPDVPAGSTARQFSRMSEEAPPWQIVLVPERTAGR